MKATPKINNVLLKRAGHSKRCDSRNILNLMAPFIIDTEPEMVETKPKPKWDMRIKLLHGPMYRHSVPWYGKDKQGKVAGEGAYLVDMKGWRSLAERLILELFGIHVHIVEAVEAGWFHDHVTDDVCDDDVYATQMVYLSEEDRIIHLATKKDLMMFDSNGITSYTNTIQRLYGQSRTIHGITVTSVLNNRDYQQTYKESHWLKGFATYQLNQMAMEESHEGIYLMPRMVYKNRAELDKELKKDRRFTI